MMTFSDIEEEKLIKNRDAIITWVQENILPSLELYKHYAVIETNNHYGKYCNLWYFRVSNKDGIECGFNLGGMKNLDMITNPDNLYIIISQWKKVKEQLIKELNERKHIEEVIYNFEV